MGCQLFKNKKGFRAKNCKALYQTINLFSFTFIYNISFLFCRVIVGAPKADTSQYQQGVVQGGAVYRCDISDDNRCQVIHFDSNGKCLCYILKSLLLLLLFLLLLLLLTLLFLNTYTLINTNHRFTRLTNT